MSGLSTVRDLKERLDQIEIARSASPTKAQWLEGSLYNDLLVKVARQDPGVECLAAELLKRRKLGL